jgi:hypothetical protein
MSNLTAIDDALSDAINSLAAAQSTLRKSLPGRAIDVLRKADHVEPQPSDDIAERALAMLETLTRQVDELKAAAAKRIADDAARLACAIR